MTSDVDGFLTIIGLFFFCRTAYLVIGLDEDQNKDEDLYFSLMNAFLL